MSCFASSAAVGLPVGLLFQQQGVDGAQGVYDRVQLSVHGAVGLAVRVQEGLVLWAEYQFAEAAQPVAVVAHPQRDESGQVPGHAVRFDDEEGEAVRLGQA
ncbi:hypothetical protein ACFVGY_35275 [Streptomyces sp. NPDC127106]|uniref:hypothetical protein n=1 Tax=Streptomyces sp. NPDC127106 TaxID=3345360 RepID=UPI003629D481